MKLKTLVMLTLIGVGVAFLVILAGGFLINGTTLDGFSLHKTASKDPNADVSLPTGETGSTDSGSGGSTPGGGTSNNNTGGGTSNGGSSNNGGGTTNSGGGTGGNTGSTSGGGSGSTSGGGTTGGSTGGTTGGTGGGTPASPSISSFTASPSSISYNSASTLTWASANTSSCSISPTLGAVGTSGSKSTGNLTGSTTYTLNCGGATRTAAVSVGAAPPNCGQSGGTCTAAQVATHNSSSNCWVTYNGYYYIVTSYISNHPGGQSVFNSTTCGHDITAYMNGSASAAGKKHGHSNGAYNSLNSYRIGQVSG